VLAAWLPRPDVRTLLGIKDEARMQKVRDRASKKVGGIVASRHAAAEAMSGLTCFGRTRSARSMSSRATTVARVSTSKTARRVAATSSGCVGLQPLCRLHRR
jgi:hypothetical protein